MVALVPIRELKPNAIEFKDSSLIRAKLPSATELPAFAPILVFVPSAVAFIDPYPMDALRPKPTDQRERTIVPYPMPTLSSPSKRTPEPIPTPPEPYTADCVPKAKEFSLRTCAPTPRTIELTALSPT